MSSSSSSADRDALERLDDRVVPSLQRGARQAAHVLGAPLRGLADLEERTGPVFRFANQHRGSLLLLAVLMATVASAVHFERYPELRDQRVRDQAAAQEQSVIQPEQVEGAGEGAVAVGPPIGLDVSRYIDRRGEALAELPDDESAVAVASFTEYLTAEQAAEVIPDNLEVRAAQYRLPGSLDRSRPLETEIVDGLVPSFDRVVKDTIADLEREIEDVRTTLDSEGVSEEFAADYRARLDELDSMANILRTGPKIVFAVIVRGEVGALEDLAAKGEVRLVDPAPADADPDRSTFYGLLPEDGTEATYGRRTGSGE